MYEVNPFHPIKKHKNQTSSLENTVIRWFTGSGYLTGHFTTLSTQNVVLACKICFDDLICIYFFSINLGASNMRTYGEQAQQSRLLPQSVNAVHLVGNMCKESKFPK